MAMKAHNDKRKEHCATVYTGDVDMAKAMQKMLNDKQAATKPADRDVKYRTCQENFYEAPAGTKDKDVQNKNLATDFWYSKKTGYNFKTGAAADKATSDMFTRVVWDVTAGKVAFARRGKYVMAWYCPSGKTGINVGDASAYVKAVKDSTCEKACNDDLAKDLYSKCYNPKAVKAHNAKRDLHKVPKLEMDIDIAKRA
jgi:hypothetical protein